MAGLGKKTFVQGAQLNASELNGYLMEQAVMRFDTSSARSTAIPSPSEGMLTYLADSDTLSIHTGVGWVDLINAGYLGTGSWIPFIPTFTNLTVGNGTVAITYIRIGKTIHMRGRLTFGTTTSVAGAISISLPVTANGVFSGSLTMRAGGTDYLGYIATSTTTFTVNAVNAAGTYATRATTSATVPGTWTTNDNISFSITYEAA